jgi:cell division protein FtsB
MKPERKNAKRITMLLRIACLILAVALSAVIIGFVTAMTNNYSQITGLQALTEQQQSEIDSLKQQVNDLQNADVANLTAQVAEKNAQIANLTSQNDALADEIVTLQTQLTQNGTAELTVQEKIRDSVMDYIKFNHPETAQFMSSLVWTGGRTTPATLVGAETYIYTSSGWKLTISYPVVPNPLYNVTADYSAPFTGIPYRVIWNGSCQNWQIKENSYVFAQ